MRFDGRTAPPSEVRACLALKGWVILSDLVPDVTPYQTAFNGVIGRYDPYPCNLVQITGARNHSTTFATYLRAPFWDTIRSILGVSSIQLLQDVLLFKPAGSISSVTWHTDYSYTCFLEPDHIYSVRLSLTQATADSGCLEVIEGSHRWPIESTERVLASTLGRSALEALPDGLKEKAHEARKVVLLQPGDISIHHCRLLHGSFENQTLRAQQVLVHHVFDGACRLRPEAVPPEARAYFPYDAQKRLLSEYFPILANSARGLTG